MAVAGGKSTAAPHNPGWLFTVILAGQLIVGGGFTVMVNVVGIPVQITGTPANV
jgi:hypothetical protein